jgi:hypothetical protein
VLVKGKPAGPNAVEPAVHHVTAGQPRFPPGQARCDPCHEVIEQAAVRGMVYRGSSGHRVIVQVNKPA